MQKLLSSSIFRADLFAKIKILNYDFKHSSEKLFSILGGSSTLSNVHMTKVRKDKETHGKITIEEWYEITGSIDVPEGGKAFWVLSKESSDKEPYNFFMRLDRNITAENYENAQKKVLEWADTKLLNPINKDFSVEEKVICSPVELSSIVKKMRGSL